MIPSDILKKIRQIQIRTRHMVNDVFAGQYHSVFKGQGMEFQEVREYIPGDDIRAIDWNVTARMGHPFIKKYREERELTVMLLVDISGSQHVGSSEQFKTDLAAELAAVLAFSAIKNNDRVGLILFSEEVELYIPPRKGTPHVLRVIREVLYFQPKHAGTKVEAALTFLNHVAHRKTVSFLISDFMDSKFDKALKIATKRHDLISIVIGDRNEETLPKVGILRLLDAETGKRVLLDTGDASTRRKWASRFKKRRESLLATLRSSGSDTIEVQAGEPYEREFIRFFKARERRMRT